MNRNSFIVIEGIDGSGKSTLVENLKNMFSKKKNQNRFSFFYEPTKKSRWGIELREILKTSQRVDEALNEKLIELYKKDRLWDIKKNIRPALENLETVIVDRYYFSTAAYQGLNKTQTQSILRTYENDSKIIKPNILIYLDLKPTLALERITKRSSQKQIFEYKRTLERIYENYSYILKNLSGSMKVIHINASLKPKKLLEHISKNCLLA